MSAAITITVPYKGKAEVTMPWAPPPNNRRWLHHAIDTRRPEWDPNQKVWLIPRAAARRVFDEATADGRPATLTHVFKPTSELCDERCQAAKLETVDDCTCVCGGQNHGRSSPGWKQVGDHLLVRSAGDDFLTRTVSNLGQC